MPNKCYAWFIACIVFVSHKTTQNIVNTNSKQKYSYVYFMIYHLFSINWWRIDMFSRLAYVQDTRWIWRIRLLLLGVWSPQHHHHHHIIIIGIEKEKRNTTTSPPQYNSSTMGLNIDFMFIRVLRFNLFDPVQSTGIHSDDALFSWYRWKKRKNKRMENTWEFKRNIIVIAWLNSLIDYQLQRLSLRFYFFLLFLDLVMNK